MSANIEERPEVIITTRPPLRADAIRLTYLLALMAIPLAMSYPERLPSFLNELSVENALMVWQNPFFWIIIAVQLVHARFMWYLWKDATDPADFTEGVKELIGYIALSIWVGFKEEFTIRWGAFFAISFLIAYMPVGIMTNYVITLILTSLLFGYLHFNLSDYLRVRGALVGFLFGIIMIMQGTILGAVLAHIIGDVLGSVMGFVLLKLKYRQLVAARAKSVGL